MAVRVETVAAVEVNRFEIHAEPHAGRIDRPGPTPATIDDRIYLHFAIDNRPPLIAASAALKVITGLEIAGAFQQLGRHAVWTELRQHRLRLVSRVIDGIIRVGLD